MEPIQPDHKRLLDIIRELYVQSGGEPLGKPENYGLNMFYPSRTGRIEVDFDYGIPTKIHS